MSYSVSDIRLEELAAYWKNPAQSLNWPYPFVIPPWLEAWWASFGKTYQPHIKAVRDGGELLGIAPLMVSGGSLTFLGSTDVCDYQDFILRSGREHDFFTVLFDNLKADGFRELELKHVRPDSQAMTSLQQFTGEKGFQFISVAEDTTVEMDLPTDFESYLAMLSSKQRHEVRRKLRRISEAGIITYHLLHDMPRIRQALDGFFSMFVESRDDKASFLTPEMKEFFTILMEKLGEAGILRLGILELDGLQVAAIICFDYGQRRYLYNCGYKPDYTGLSVGLVSKVMTIQDSIEKGFRTFDFLKGNETYKYHLGGRDVPLSRCTIDLT